MSKNLVGLLLGALGAAVAWLLRGKLRPERGIVHKRYITLRSKKGGCGIEAPPAPVELRQNPPDQVHWIISNPSDNTGSCDRDVRVCVGRWTRNGSPADPPVVDGDNGQYCRTVRPGQTKRLPGRAKQNVPTGDYHYDVLIDGQIAVDPIVRLVP